MSKTLLDYLQLVSVGVFQGCMGALIVCIGSGKIVLQHGKVSTRVMFISPQSFWKQLPHKIYWFGMLFLVKRCDDLIVSGLVPCLLAMCKCVVISI